jgi:hypothetical protein
MAKELRKGDSVDSAGRMSLEKAEAENRGRCGFRREDGSSRSFHQPADSDRFLNLMAEASSSPRSLAGRRPGNLPCLCLGGAALGG